MKNSEQLMQEYLNHCEFQKRLDAKTLKAYKIDLLQFWDWVSFPDISKIDISGLENFITALHKKYKPKTVKRKIASLKAFFRYAEYKNYISINPFNKIQIRFREPVILPKTIALSNVEKLLRTAYQQQTEATTEYQRMNAVKDAAILELLFATGIRISELCNLKKKDVDLREQRLLIFGKSSKERKIHLGNPDVLKALLHYADAFELCAANSDFFFVNQHGEPVSDQAVRRMINKYSKHAGISTRITPHMFRHTFATGLLEADVDIRYIQEILGHSSINTTAIYTHLAMSKQKDILTNKHPRNGLSVRSDG